jgi:hypothetical protein
MDGWIAKRWTLFERQNSLKPRAISRPTGRPAEGSAAGDFNQRTRLMMAKSQISTF